MNFLKIFLHHPSVHPLSENVTFLFIWIAGTIILKEMKFQWTRARPTIKSIFQNTIHILHAFHQLSAIQSSILAKVQQFPVCVFGLGAPPTQSGCWRDAILFFCCSPFVEVRILSDTWYSGWKQHPGRGQSLHPLCNSSCGNWVRVRAFGAHNATAIGRSLSDKLMHWKRRSLCHI